ncbi:kinase-like domain-containing protein [Achaetomium macrosporum]|uniref:non-specific serine/threonine protein kinase n=1 Tax=Achaetomium macrosporum TaxID=79813 RepID=A0AAN7C648_9PEZI|nr:kinase-like domain-containing protein [Achaetomium macrosporum]
MAAPHESRGSRPANDWNPYSFFIHDPFLEDIQHESLYSYQPGGYHPVAIDDEFHGGRYIIRHKLGWGGFSTVWFALDIPEQCIKTANYSILMPDNDPEVRVVCYLEQRFASSQLEKPRFFAPVLDTFRHEGPNGTHNCIVTDFVGPSIEKVLETYNDHGLTLRPDTILRAAQQLLDAVAFAHQLGIAHGDISYTNVAFTCKADAECDEDLLDAMGSEPATIESKDEKGERPPNVPKQMIEPAGWPMRVQSLPQPLNLRAPESFFVDGFGYRQDLWRAGCVICAIFYQDKLCKSLGAATLFVRELISKLGPLPASWQARWESMLSADTRPEAAAEAPITETFELRRQQIISSCLNDKQNMYEQDEHTDHDFEALACLKHLMLCVLQYEPDKRVTAAEAASWIRQAWTDYRREEWERERDRESDEAGEDNDDEGQGSPAASADIAEQA